MTQSENWKIIWIYCTAVKSNALAELMNRASKIHWKNLSLTLNGRNSETKNDKNNPKVPKFPSCRGLSSTLSRKCGSTTLCGCFVGVCGCFWVFVGVRGVTICHYWLKHAPGTTWQGEEKKFTASSKMTVRQ